MMYNIFIGYSKNNLIKIVLLLAILNGINLSQPSAIPDQNINIFWDFYSNNRMSTIDAGKGYTGIASENDISGIALNPANLNIEKKFQVHTEYVYKTDVPWGSSWGNKGINLKTIYPSFMAGGAYKINKYLQTGLLWYTANSRKLDLGELTYTNEFGQEITTVDAVQNMSINSLLLPVVFNYKNRIKTGINFSLLYYHGYVNYITTPNNPNPHDASVNVFNFNVQIGFIVMPFEGLSIGGTFAPQVKQQFKWSTSDGVVFPSSASNVFPIKIGLGTEYRFKKYPLRIDFDYNYTNTSKQDGLKDRNDFYFGVEYDFLKQLTLRTGFFTLKDYRQNSGHNYYLDPIGKYDEYFFTLGGTYKIKKYSFSIALMDSHISPGLIQQTLINGGITMDF